MRKVNLILVGVVMELFLVCGSAIGVGIDIYSTVNPNYNDSWNQNTLTGTALYTLRVLPDSDYGANVFSVTFESDIFASLGAVQLLAPSGWTITYYENSKGSYMYEVATGGVDLLEPGENPPVSFLVDYTLHSAEQYYNASGLNWSWDEGGSWMQSVSATNTLVSLPSYLGGGNPSGGNSTAHVPEPMTMLLLGSGLIGLSGLGRKYFKKA